MHLVEPRAGDGGLDWRHTLLRWHVAEQLGQTQRLDVLAIEELLQEIDVRDPAARAEPEVRRWLSRRQFFYRTYPDQRLYIPVRLRVADGFTPHATDVEQYRLNQWQHAQECRQAFREKQKPPTRTSFDLSCYPELSDLILAMHRRLNDPREPDRRGIVLLSRSGAGKTLACRKSFYDCFYATPDDEAVGQPQARLAGFLPCWVSLAGKLSEIPEKDLIESLVVRTAQSGAATPVSVKAVRALLTCGPPLLLFFDLNAAAAAAQDLVARALVAFQQEYGRYGHRCIVTYRSSRSDAPAMQSLGGKKSEAFGFYDLVPIRIPEACEYPTHLRQFEKEIFTERLPQYAPQAYRPPTTADIEADRNKLAQLAAQHVRAEPAGPESLISTPLLMHFAASLPHGKLQSVETLYDLYKHVVDKHLARDEEEYPGRLACIGQGVQERRERLLTAMTRIALAIQAQGPDVFRLPSELARHYACVSTDPETGAWADWVPQEDFWRRASCYYADDASDPPPVPALLEFSLLKLENGQTGFVHDSLVSYFAGAVALVEYQQPGAVGALNSEWIAQVVARIMTQAEVWQLAAGFLAGRLAAVDRARRQSVHCSSLKPILHELAQALVLACDSAPKVQLLQSYARGALADSVLGHIEQALRWHPGFLAEFPEKAFSDVCNYLAWWEDTNVQRQAFHTDLEKLLQEGSS